MPTIVFQVNLATPLLYKNKQPYDLATLAGNFPSTRNTWFEDNLLDNHKLKHGDTFTVNGANALYLLNNFTTGDYAFLTVVSNVGNPP